MITIKVFKHASPQFVYEVLHRFDEVFRPALHTIKPDLSEYAKKIGENALLLIAENEEEYLGFCVLYANMKPAAYIAQIAVEPSSQGKGVGGMMLKTCQKIAKESGMKYIKLAVDKTNEKAIRLYQKYGFKYESEASNKQYYYLLELNEREK